MKKLLTHPWLWLGLIILVFLAIFLTQNTYYLHILGAIAVTVLVAVGLNILTGLSGQVSIGHAGFFAMGAYSSSLLMTKLHWNFWLAAIFAVMISAITGLILAAPALRVTGPYLAMITIAFGIIVERILIEWVDLTGGFGGIFNIPQPTLFNWFNFPLGMQNVVFLAWGSAILALFSFTALKNHDWGRAWQAVRDDQIAAATVGLNVLRIPLVAFTVSAAFTGLGGVFWASIVGFISPGSFTFHRSILFLLVIILGGLGTAAGSVVGAIALVILPELVNNFAEYQLLVFGILLLLTLWLTPEGVVSFFLQRFRDSDTVYPPAMSGNNLGNNLPALLVNHQTDVSLQVEQMSISFGGVQAVDHVDFMAQGGTITSIIGSNGAGKTTLLNLLAGFYRPEAGSVYLGNLDLTGKNTSEVVLAGLSRTFQTTRLFNSLSVLDNLKVGYVGDRLGNIFTALLGWQQKTKSSLETQLIELLAFVGYQDNIHARADSLAFGDRRLVEIARALATRPQVILLDEPAAGLSEQQRKGLARLLRCLRDAGIIVILIEHDINLVMEISDRIVVLDRGRVICDDTTARVRNNQRVLEAYLGVAQNEITSPLSNSTTPILAIENLTAGYGQLQVLQAISLEVRQGELVAVVGANGAGKTTLLKSIAQLVKARSGRVLFRGANLTKLLPQQLANQGVVLIPEGRQVFTQLSVMDNLRLGAFQRQDAQIGKDIDLMLERFPALKPLLKQPAGLLSGGEQQMLAIARGLMAKPQVLLLDEPSLGLAPQLVATLYATLASLCEEGISILLVDQIAQLAFAVAHRLYILETGKIIQTGTPDELKRDSAMIDAYLGNLHKHN
jgi:branched-chain amino acid transport system ATP-binding protein